MPNVLHMPPTIEHLPTSEVASVLSCDVRTVHRLVARGDLTPVIKLPGIRGALLFARTDVEALAERRAAA